MLCFLKRQSVQELVILHNVHLMIHNKSLHKIEFLESLIDIEPDCISIPLELLCRYNTCSVWCKCYITIRCRNNSYFHLHLNYHLVEEKYLLQHLLLHQSLMIIVASVIFFSPLAELSSSIMYH